MPRFSQSSVVSKPPRTRSRSGTGSMPQAGGVLATCAPFAGPNQIRFDGCDLSPALAGTPARSRLPTLRGRGRHRSDRALPELQLLALLQLEAHAVRDRQRDERQDPDEHAVRPDLRLVG